MSHSAGVFCWVHVLSPATENDLKRLAGEVLANHSPCLSLSTCRKKSESCPFAVLSAARQMDIWTAFSIERGPSPGLIAGPHTRAEGNVTIAMFTEHLLCTRSL